MGNHTMARQCMVATISRQPSAEPSASTEKGLWQSATLVLPGNESADEVKCEDLEKVAVGVDPEKFFQVDSELPSQEKEELIGFLRENTNVFAWNAYEALGVYPSFICHHLNFNPSVTPKKQPP